MFLLRTKAEPSILNKINNATFVYIWTLKSCITDFVECICYRQRLTSLFVEEKCWPISLLRTKSEKSPYVWSEAQVLYKVKWQQQLLYGNILLSTRTIGIDNWDTRIDNWDTRIDHSMFIWVLQPIWDELQWWESEAVLKIDNHPNFINDNR